MKPVSAIRVDGVTKRYGSVTAVDGVSLEVQRGEFLTLLGPSGSGKTTLIRLVAGFEDPDAGRIHLGGIDVTGKPPFRRRVHTVFQQYVLFPHLNVFKNIAFGLEQKRTARHEIARKVGEALDLVRLAGYERRMPDELSGGEQQRVAVARAVVLEPDALLLDEPLAALDLKLRKEMQLELKRLQRQLDITFLLVTHDQEEAMAMSDRIAVMSRGRLLQIGTPEQIYEKPETAFVANFIGLSNIFDGTIVSAQGHAALVEFHGHRFEIPVNGTPPVGPRVQFAVRPEKIGFRQEPHEADGWIQLQGIIADRLYLGDVTQWQVRVGEQLITVSVQNRSPAAENVRHGQSAYLGWDIKSIVFLSNPD